MVCATARGAHAQVIAATATSNFVRMVRMNLLRDQYVVERIVGLCNAGS
jgi:hypothetical protein